MVISAQSEEAELSTDSEPESCGNDIGDDENVIDCLLSPAGGGAVRYYEEPTGFEIEAPSVAAVCLPAKYLNSGRMLLEKGHGVFYIMRKGRKWIIKNSLHEMMQGPRRDLYALILLCQEKIEEAYLRYENIDGMGAFDGKKAREAWRKFCDEVTPRLNAWNYKIESFAKVWQDGKYFEDLFVISPMDVIPYERSCGKVILGEGFGISHVRLRDFTLKQPDKLVMIDPGLWQEFSLLMAPLGAAYRRVHCNCNVPTIPQLFVLFSFYLLVLSQLVVAYGWSFSSLVFCVPATFVSASIANACVSLWHLFLVRPVLCKAEKVFDDFTARFRGDGYQIEFFEEKGLFVFSPHQDVNMVL